jgi:hypothetical protein
MKKEASEDEKMSVIKDGDSKYKIEIEPGSI